MKAKHLLLSGVCGLLAGGMFLVGSLPAEAAAVTGPFEAGIYNGRLDKHGAFQIYKVAGEDDVPYVSAENYLTWLYNGNVFVETEGSKLIAVRNDTKVIFDTDTEIISSDSLDDFFGSDVEGELTNGILGPDDFEALTISTRHPAVETQGKSFSVNLSSYGLSMVEKDGQVLVPFAVMQNIFGVPCSDTILSFNGSDFYNLGLETFGFIYGDTIDPNLKMNPYADAYYSGEFSRRKEIPAAYSRYAYGTTCLLFDLYYGHKEELGIDSFDAYIKENGLKEKMLSSDAKSVSQAFHELVDMTFNSGHDRVLLGNSVFDDGRHVRTGQILKAYDGLKPMVEALQKLCYRVSDKGVDFMAGEVGTYDQYEAACQELHLNPILLNYIFREKGGSPNKSWYGMSQDFAKVRGTKEENIEVDTQIQKVYGTYTEELFGKMKHMDELKPKDFGSSRVEFIDDTAFIYFERFANDISASKFYYHLPSELAYDASTFGLFYDAFDEIQKRPWITKVVIDLSANGGGNAAALTAALGFLSPDGEVNLTYYNTLSQNYCSEWYHVDTNLDGKFDSQDGFGGKYDFYILTSGFSYSCANALPFFAQADGLAKIIGEQPGGGDCVVTNFLDAYGHVARMSGCAKLGRMTDGKFVSDEHAVKVDYPFGEQADQLYYNYKSLAQWLKDKK